MYPLIHQHLPVLIRTTLSTALIMAHLPPMTKLHQVSFTSHSHQTAALSLVQIAPTKPSRQPQPLSRPLMIPRTNSTHTLEQNQLHPHLDLVTCQVPNLDARTSLTPSSRTWTGKNLEMPKSSGKSRNNRRTPSNIELGPTRKAPFHPASYKNTYLDNPRRIRCWILPAARRIPQADNKTKLHT